jgi:hypothetical protein
MAERREFPLRVDTRQSQHLSSIIPRGTHADLYHDGWQVTISALTTAQLERLAEFLRDGL